MDRLYDLWEYAKVEYDNRVFKTGDPRLQDWPMVKSPVPTMMLILAYFLMCYLGPKIMATRKAFELRTVLAVYNFMMVGISFCIFMELTIPAMYLEYNFICDPLEYSTSPTHMRLATAIYIYYICKLLEFADTAFFIIRKKNSQVTFLHVYHHGTMAMYWWIGVKWYAGGLAFFPAMVNCFVHVVMYSYYGLSVFPSLRKYLWWKRYLTILQLTQFAAIMSINTYNLIFGCSFDTWVNWLLVIYVGSFFVLFANFYLKSYICKRINKNIDSDSRMKKERIGYSPYNLRQRIK